MAHPLPLGGRVIDAFGGPVKMSQATGWPVSTIESWKSKASIPRWRLRDIHSAALANQVRLPEDFPTASTQGASGKSKKRNVVARANQTARFFRSWMKSCYRV